MRLWKACAATLTLMLLSVQPALADEVIRYEEFRLDNGLRVVVHEDRDTPIVHVGVWYHVGSANEAAGRTGLAHLFEHIMFRGSEHFSGSYAETLRAFGVSGLNGTTGTDRTNFFQTTPTPALEAVLWLESDRMGHLLGAVTQEVLDAERSIVQNEKRQVQGAPRGQWIPRTMAGIFPMGHPYHHTTIGSMEDLESASLEDVHQWFRDYYGAANALLVLAGDIDVETARTLAQRYFGHIPAGPPVARVTENVPVRTRNTYEVIADNVPAPSVSRAWALPSRRDADATLLQLSAEILARGDTSRLHRELVHERRLATNVIADVFPLEVSSLMFMTVLARPGVEVAEVERALDEILREYLADGPTEEELQRIKNSKEANLIFGLERVNQRGIALAEGALFHDDPGYLNEMLQTIRGANIAQLHAVNNAWLGDGYHQIVFVPHGTYQTQTSDVDRTSMPEVQNDLVLDLPDLQYGELSNGVKIVLAEQRAVPTVGMVFFFEGAGVAASGGGAQAAMMHSLLESGPANLSIDAFADAQEELGVRLQFLAGDTYAMSAANALSRNLPGTLALIADIMRDPAFRDEERGTIASRMSDSYMMARANPGGLASMVLWAALYDPAHPYYPSLAFDRAEQARLNDLTVDELRAAYQRAFRPDTMTVFVAGDTSLSEITALLEAEFGDWRVPADAPPPLTSVTPPAASERPRVILLDFPNTPQSTIFVGRVLPAGGDPEVYWPIRAANDAFGGNPLTSRIGQNLRVERGWSYGATSMVRESEWQGLWAMNTSVQTDRTADSIEQIVIELQRLADNTHPITEEELSLFQRSTILTLPGQFETKDSLVRDMVTNNQYGRPYDDTENTPARIRALTLEAVNEAARTFLSPGNLTWVVAGDLSRIEEGVRALGLGDVEVWNTDGERVR